MAELRIAYERGGYRLMVSTNGIGERPHGPLWPTPKEASLFWDSYRASHLQAVSPLRREQGDMPDVEDIPAPAPAAHPAGRAVLGDPL